MNECEKLTPIMMNIEEFKITNVLTYKEKYKTYSILLK